MQLCEIIVPSPPFYVPLSTRHRCNFARLLCPHRELHPRKSSLTGKRHPGNGSLTKLPLRGHKACLRRNFKNHEKYISPSLRGFATPIGATLRDYCFLILVPRSTFPAPQVLLLPDPPSPIPYPRSSLLESLTFFQPLRWKYFLFCGNDSKIIPTFASKL